MTSNNNYTSYKGVITFFDDTKPAPLPPPGGAVFRRPPGPAWASVPQIRGDYDAAPEYDYDIWI
jgi:hypothetical protein